MTLTRVLGFIGLTGFIAVVPIRLALGLPADWVLVLHGFSAGYVLADEYAGWLIRKGMAAPWQ